MKKIVTLLLILCSATVAAETAYVTDELEITLRTGETTGHRIVRMLPTGEKLTVLGTNPDSGYSKVRTSNGTVGFVLTRQLVDTPVARDRLAAAEAEVKALKAAPNVMPTSAEPPPLIIRTPSRRSSGTCARCWPRPTPWRSPATRSPSGWCWSRRACRPAGCS